MRVTLFKIFGLSNLLSFSFLLVIISTSPCSAQVPSGFLKGRVIDGSTYNKLYGVAISINSDSTISSTLSDGSYLLNLKTGDFTIAYRLDGYQAKVVSGIHINNREFTQQDIILYPVSQKTLDKYKERLINDSVKKHDSIVLTTTHKENSLSSYNSLRNFEGQSDIIYEEKINPGNDKNAGQLLKRLNGVIVQSEITNPSFNYFTILGMGEKYNQLMLNGALLNSFTAEGKNYPFNLLPAEAIKKVSVQKTGTSSVPADFTGGVVKLTLKDFPDNNFFYVQAGSGFSGNTISKDFYGDTRQSSEFFSFPGDIRNLSSSFPTTKSQTAFNDKTAQEKTDLSKLLKNNLAPVNHGTSKPNTKFILGFGKIFKSKNENKFGIIGYLTQSKSEIIDQSSLQILPDVSGNQYPFADINRKVINAQSRDMNYRYASQLAGTLNASLTYGHNKISLTNFFGSIFNNTYTQRTNISKPDEDTLAKFGIHYLATHQVFLITQLSGEHLLSEDGKFKLSWHATYNYQREQSPDERSFLLRQDSFDVNKYELAHISAVPFNPQSPQDPNILDPNLTNSSRLWRTRTDNNFEAAADISVPFYFLHQAQFISGGIYIQSKNRIFYSDLLQTTGGGYLPLQDLLSPDRYASGDLSVRSYFSNFGGSYSYVYANNRGNYTGSANTGASYIWLKNKLTKNLLLNWGARVESGTQLVSNTQYNYITGDTKPTIGPLDKNTFVSKTDFLPSVQIGYEFTNNLEFYASYFKTVNRPQFQELTSYRYYDPLRFFVKIGNPILQNSLSSNFDAGFKWLPNSGISFTLSGYYKKINQPIENILTSYTTASLISQPHNTPPAKIFGLDASFKLSLANIINNPVLSNFYVFANGTWLNAKVEPGHVRNIENVLPEHNLSGSPDYTFNTGLLFNKPRFPQLTVLYNRTGDYISDLGSGTVIKLANGNSISTIPAYRVKGSDQLDVQVAQKIFKAKIQVIAGINNVTKNHYVLYQDLNGNKKFDAPLTTKILNGSNGFYQSGIDNTIVYIKSQRNYYLTISYIF